MTWFPQNANGCIAQLPIQRRHVWRAISNRFESGEMVAAPDAGGGRVEWTLSCKDLSDSEAEALRAFFHAARGSFGTFSFADPTANLLASSEDLNAAAWEKGLLSLVGAVPGPTTGMPGFRITNGTGAGQALAQSVALPTEYIACFSVWLRSDAPCSVVLRRGPRETTARVTDRWKRWYLSSSGSEDASAFALDIPAGGAVEAAGFQVEAGPYPSAYKRSAGVSAIYENTSFASDRLAMVATGPGLHDCNFTLISRL